MFKTLTLLAALIVTSGAHADAPIITKVEASRAGMGWRFDVTLQHPDTGWEHYADGWELIDAAGNQIAYRELMHPHVEEQPFTRSLRNVMLPDGMTKIWVRARCSENGWSEKAFEVSLPY
ncbi:hypothetical protein [Lentibacter sp. XHP0401]|uniref:hypothetical protein n=1 Tax=Lentibacter sp. XHP0401 TaxID=2984334 RepID=UPI0021E78550|nr:hypothetical protein [Lentibacter sp. XHP0401]MCV2893773.1 hypothetical protein [Lentibacter sp. XHP0401]